MADRYLPGAPPPEATIEQVLAFCQREFLSIATALNDGTRQMDILHVEPKRLREGLVAVADGTDWNPGSGQGAYVYRGGAWHFLG